METKDTKERETTERNGLSRFERFPFLYLGGLAFCHAEIQWHYRLIMLPGERIST